MTDATFFDTPHRRATAWGAVLSMSLSVAMLIAAEFMPVSLLTPMAQGLGASEGATGQAISISGLFALVQIFVAMEPNETLYFANPGSEGIRNHIAFWKGVEVG